MRRKLPKEIKIGPLVYKVKRVAQTELPEDENAHISPDTLEILIRKRAKYNNVAAWLVHELFHGCHNNSGKYDDTLRTDEQWIESTTLSWLQILRDNSKLIEYLTDFKCISGVTVVVEETQGREHGPLLPPTETARASS